MSFKTITFYKFIKIEKPEELMIYIRGVCEALDLKGRILIGNEGINAGVSGEENNIEQFKNIIKKERKFQDLTFREQKTNSNSYHNLVVRVRNEIVVFGRKVDMKNKAQYVSPEKLKKWYDKNEDFIILDARNNYEAEIGKFKNAFVLPIESFKELPNSLNKIENLKDKKIVTYCTGGIRCEKATAYMKQVGFNNVFQLKGGIIEYVNEFPGQEFEGSLFVFDDRLVADTGSEKKLGKCKICNKPCNDYTDCYNLDCDKLFVCCDDCKIKMNNTCSEECKNSERLRNGEFNREIVKELIY